MKITYCVATSRDGYIARENGDVSWLEDLNIDMGETGLDAFFAGIDGLVMGRATYDFVYEHGTWPYKNKPSWVCTHSDLEILAGANLIVVKTVDDVIDGATTNGLKHLWLLGGGRLASSFLDQQLITDLSISQMPVDLGSGIPLFANHELENIPVKSKNAVQKKGFKQIEIALKT